MGKSNQGVQTSAERYTVIPRVLAFIFNGDNVLLIKGAPTKRIWANRYNGVGGHVQASEDIYSAARREIEEETGLEVHDLRFQGLINIDVGQETGVLLAVFVAHSDVRETRPSAEGMLEWVPLDRIHEYDLVQDIPILLERIVDTAKETIPFFARYAYDSRDQLCITFAER
jgi:8-oxo-dGTP diphosphatase